MRPSPPTYHYTTDNLIHELVRTRPSLKLSASTAQMSADDLDGQDLEAAFDAAFDDGDWATEAEGAEQVRETSPLRQPFGQSRLVN